MGGANLKRLYLKLAAAIIALVIAVTVTVSLSYAWSILSTSPAVKGAQVAVSGGSTILVAPDVVTTVNDVTYHYPGEFSTDLRMTGDSYSYLSSLTGLTPSSTADGENWVVQNGTMLDQNLNYANRTDGGGGYVYVDFWVVAPRNGYYLRVSSGAGTTTRGGSESTDGAALISLPDSIDGGSDGLILGVEDHSISRSARVGFLVNDASADSTTLYAASESYDGRFSELRGRYAEKGSSQSAYSAFNEVFTIWEPDGLTHNDPSLNGSYLITKPLGPDGNGGLEDKSVSAKRLAVQTGSLWKTTVTENGEQRLIDQYFRGWVNGRGLNADNAADEFYAKEGLDGTVGGWPISSYISSGSFIRSTESLLEAAGSGDSVDPASVSGLLKAGATEDVILCRLDPDVPQRIRMFIWIEGADADCPSSMMSSGRFALTVQLAGSDTGAGG